MNGSKYGLILAASLLAWLAAIPLGMAQTPASAVDEALQNITTLKRAGRVGYATFWVGNKFVQCRRLAGGDMRCEAPATRLQPSLKSVLTPARREQLASLGWALNPDFGNYTQDFPKEVPTREIVDLVLQTLTDGYDANTAALELSTNWVADTPCPPRAGRSQNLAGSVNDSLAMRNVVIRACSYEPQQTTEPAIAANAAELVSIYGADVTAEIQRLRLNANRRVWIVLEAGIGYIQCMPERPAVALYCEAQSADSWPALATVLTPARVARLRQAGYADPGHAPNYSRSYPLDAFNDAALARELLTLMHEVYGYTGSSKLRIATEQGVVSK